MKRNCSGAYGGKLRVAHAFLLSTAWLRALLVASLSLFFGCLYALFYWGFGFLANSPIHIDIVAPLYNAFFLHSC